MPKLLTKIARFPAGILLGLVRLYQRLISPVLPAVFGSACGCRFQPTCSHYAAEALSRHGALTGSWLTFKRIIKCNPLHSGGLDPVPPPRCTRVASHHKTTLSHG